MKPLRILFAFSVLTALCPTACAQASRDVSEDLAPAVFVDGEPIDALLVQVDGEGNALFEVPEDDNQERITRPLAGLVYWGHPREATGPQVILQGGTLLVADLLRLDEERALLLGDSFDVAIPRTALRGVVFRPPLAPEARDQWFDHLATTESDADRIFLANGDELAGEIVEMSNQMLRIESEVRDLELPVAKVTAIFFSSAAQERVTDEVGFVVGLADGSLLGATDFILRAEGTSITLAGGIELELSSADEVVFVQPTLPNVTYLSDLEPSKFQHTPYLSLKWPLERDRNVLGHRLRAGGKLFAKGLGVHSTSTVVYRVDGDYQQFAAELAIDDSAGKRGSVTYNVYLFQDGAWKQAYASDTVRGGDEVLPIRVDLGDAKGIALTVEFAERGDELDHADWLNARLLRPREE